MGALATQRSAIREVSLPHGLTTVVDEADYGWLLEMTRGRAWYADPRSTHRYAKITFKRARKSVTVYIHRLIAGAGRGEVADHINGDTLDNRRSNLRVCSQAENTRNKTISKANTSGYKGVYLRDNRWQALIMVGGKQRRAGCYATPIEAAVAYDHAATILHGEFAKLNFSPARDWIIPAAIAVTEQVVRERLAR